MAASRSFRTRLPGCHRTAPPASARDGDADERRRDAPSGRACRWCSAPSNRSSTWARSSSARPLCSAAASRLIPVGPVPAPELVDERLRGASEVERVGVAVARDAIGAHPGGVEALVDGPSTPHVTGLTTRGSSRVIDYASSSARGVRHAAAHRPRQLPASARLGFCSSPWARSLSMASGPSRESRDTTSSATRTITWCARRSPPASVSSAFSSP